MIGQRHCSAVMSITDTPNSGFSDSAASPPRNRKPLRLDTVVFPPGLRFFTQTPQIPFPALRHFPVTHLRSRTGCTLSRQCRQIRPWAGADALKGARSLTRKESRRQTQRPWTRSIWTRSVSRRHFCQRSDGLRTREPPSFHACCRPCLPSCESRASR